MNDNLMTDKQQTVPGEEGSAQGSVGDFLRERPKYPTAGDMLALLGIFLLTHVIGSFVVSVGMGVAGYADFALPEVQGKFIGISLLISSTLAITSMLVYRHLRGGSGTIIRLSVRGLNPILLLWGVLLIMAVNVVIEPLVVLLPEFSSEVLGRGTWMLVSTVFMAPVFEEFICRGIVLESLRSKYGAVVAVIVSSLFFGVMHLDPQQVVVATFAGLIFGFLYIRTGSLWIAIILHAINNAVAYLMLIGDAGNTTFSEAVGGGVAYILCYIAAAGLCVISVVMLWRTLRAKQKSDENCAEA